MSNPSITADKTPWYQWDTGLTVTVSGGAMTECHFANRKQGTAYVQAVINGVARVPDELLQVAAPIKAYGYVSDGAGGQTYIEQTFEVIARNIPADYTYTKTAQKTIRDAEVARDEAVQAAKDAKTSALDADDSAIEASKSAQSAGDSASAAATSARTAAKSASNAATSASEAKAAAGKVVEDASELLKTYTDNAKTSADNAATSASNAADAASSASGSASAAEQSATDASNAKAAAQTAKGEAEKAKDAAATSASNAATSAEAAAQSASDAAASVSAINVISPKTVKNAAVAPRANSLAIGESSKCTDDSASQVAVGIECEANGTVASAFGLGSSADGMASVSLGTYAHSVGDYSTAVGTVANTEGLRATAIGEYSQAIGTNSLSSGNAYVIGINSISEGYHAVANAAQSTVLGCSACVTGDAEPDVNEKDFNASTLNSVALGSFSYTDEPDCVSVGNDSDGYDFYHRAYADGDMALADTAPYWNKRTVKYPSYARKLKRRITNVAEPTDWHNAANKAYVDSNTTNALIGKVSGKLLHVEDAWPSPLLNVTIDGAYKQDGTPSPENPVPITVIENPVLKVIGRNFLDPDKMALTGTYYKNLNGELSIVSGDGRAWSTLPMYGVLPAGTYVIDGDSCEMRKALDDTVIVFTQTTKISFTLQVATEVKIKVGFGNPVNQYPYVSHCVIAMVNSGDAEYAPYVGVSLPITLPAEHPYLAALPDGTHDEIVIDKDGNASLVARTQKVVILTTNTAFGAGAESSAAYISCAVNVLSMAKSAIVSSNYVASEYTSKSGYVYLPNNTTVIYRDDRFTSKEQALELLANETTYVSIKPKTYSLGKLAIPSLPETISNAWTDAELTTNMSMIYKQDVNVVIAGLTAQINALKGTANEPPEVAGPTTE